jgi:hypothetical protein
MDTIPKAITFNSNNVTPNKPLQRSGVDKVPGRGRGEGVLEQVPCARVLRPQCPVAERGC